MCKYCEEKEILIAKEYRKVLEVKIEETGEIFTENFLSVYDEFKDGQYGDIIVTKDREMYKKLYIEKDNLIYGESIANKSETDVIIPINNCPMCNAVLRENPVKVVDSEENMVVIKETRPWGVLGMDHEVLRVYEDAIFLDDRWEEQCLRVAPPDDCQCIDSGEYIKLNYRLN